MTTPRTTRATRRRWTLAVLTAGTLLLAGCGGGGDGEGDGEGDEEASETLDSSAPGAQNLFGRFANVPKPPSKSREVTGIAEMTVADGRTRVDVLVAGLEAKGAYVAYVHSDTCSASDPGGARFTLKAGGDGPQNEIRIPIALAVGPTPRPGMPEETTSGGTGEVTVDGEATAAKSVVLHVLRKAGATADEAKPPKLACADLKAGSALEDTAESTAEPGGSASPRPSS